jgi:hypothetical protein
MKSIQLFSYRKNHNHMVHHPLLVYHPSGTAGICKKVIGEPNNKIQAKFRVYANLEAFGIYAC